MFSAGSLTLLFFRQNQVLKDLFFKQFLCCVDSQDDVINIPEVLRGFVLFQYGLCQSLINSRASLLPLVNCRYWTPFQMEACCGLCSASKGIEEKMCLSLCLLVSPHLDPKNGIRRGMFTLSLVMLIIFPVVRSRGHRSNSTEKMNIFRSLTRCLKNLLIICMESIVFCATVWIRNFRKLKLTLLPENLKYKPPLNLP